MEWLAANHDVVQSLCSHLPEQMSIPKHTTEVIVDPAFAKGVKIFGVLVILALGWQVLTPSTSAIKTPTKEAPTCAKEAWICAAEKHEIKMRWGCEDAIKDGLKDPRSYQANDVRYWPSMDVDPALVMVKINYSAKNGFGGSVRGNAVCHADASGNILSAKYL